MAAFDFNLNVLMRWAPPEVLSKLDVISRQLAALTSKELMTMEAIDDLTREVQENTDVVASAKTLLEGLKAKLDEAIAANDMSRVRELSAQLDANTQALAAAVAANTPGETGETA